MPHCTRSDVPCYCGEDAILCGEGVSVVVQTFAWHVVFAFGLISPSQSACAPCREAERRDQDAVLQVCFRDARLEFGLPPAAPAATGQQHMLRMFVQPAAATTAAAALAGHQH